MKNNCHIDLSEINIAPQIRPLVELFVKHGIQTIASCQGHVQLHPYLAFYDKDLDKVRKLIRLLNDELAKENSRLYWGWSVTPWLRDNTEIAWSLSTPPCCELAFKVLATTPRFGFTGVTSID